MKQHKFTQDSTQKKIESGSPPLVFATEEVLPKLIQITEDYFDEFLLKSDMLDALKFHGVDNWDGYDLALEDVYPKEEED